MRSNRRRFSVLLAAALLSGGVTAEAQGQTESSTPTSFWHAAGGVVFTNWFTWAHNWYIRRWPWANVGIRSWRNNLRNGFEWDNDGFIDDQLAHPYHGSFYHNSARASGYGFWSSIPFVAAGSAGWEFFGETIQASLNDLIITTLGGVAVGEVTYRLSRSLGARRSAGGMQFGRELGAFALSPLARTQQLVGGPSGWAGESPGLMAGEPARLAVGSQSGKAFFEVAVKYGSVFSAEAMRPYDAFEFRLQVSPERSEIVQHVGISGLLTRRSLHRSARSHLVLGAFQHYDYDFVPEIKSSGNSVSAALLFQRQLGARNLVNLAAHAEGLILGGISADQGHYSRRDYDLGPGIGARIGADFARDGREWLRVDGRLLWLRSIHGSGGEHLASFLRVGAMLPIGRSLGLGSDFSFTTRHSRYPDWTPVTRRVSQFQTYLTWSPS